MHKSQVENQMEGSAGISELMTEANIINSISSALVRFKKKHSSKSGSTPPFLRLPLFWVTPFVKFYRPPFFEAF